MSDLKPRKCGSHHNSTSPEDNCSSGPLLLTIGKPVLRDKIAAFDFDWTLVNPKEGKTFPKDVDDWVWFSDEVPQIIKGYYQKGFSIVIFTNQTKTWKIAQIMKACSELALPMFVCIAMEKAFHKPNPIMFDNLIRDHGIRDHGIKDHGIKDHGIKDHAIKDHGIKDHGIKDHAINKSESFFVGDALGRKSDFSDSDKVFAENIGLKVLAPESIFISLASSETFEIPDIQLKDEPEIIIMVGYPGSGKSAIASEICKSDKYIHIKGDDYKSNTPKMIKASLEYVKDHKSIVFDATNSSKKKRLLFIEFAKKHDYQVRCIHKATALDVSYKRNKGRTDKKQVPKIAYSVYKKHYDEPTPEEGFELIILP